MSTPVPAPIRWFAAAAVALGGVLPWFFTRETGDGLSTLVLGLYRDRWFVLNAAASIAALQCLAFLLSPSRKRIINLLLFNVSVGFAIIILELPFMLGFMDLQTIGQTFAAAPDHGVSRVTASNLQLEGESWPDLVTLLGVNSGKRPFNISTDRFGLRNADTREDPSIVCLGDSILYAGFLRTDELLTERLGKIMGASVLNVSEAGLSPVEEMNRFAMTGMSNADRTFLQFVFEGNDLGGAAAFASEGVADTGGWPESGVIKFVLRTLHAPRPGIAQARMGRFRARPAPSDVYFYYDAATVDLSMGHLDAMTDYYEKRSEQLAEVDSEFIVVFVPMKLTVLGPYCDWPDGSRVSDERLRTSRFRAELREACATRSIPFVDLTPALQEAAEAGELVYYPDDTHLNARGHEIIAETLARHLRDRELDGSGSTSLSDR